MLNWEVDDRPRHAYTRLYVAGMWLRRDKSAFEGAEHTERTARRLQADGDAAPTRWTRWRRVVEEDRIAGVRTWTVRRRGGSPRVRVCYLHGGGYVHPLTPDYWRLVRALTRDPDVEVVVPAYPLAPHATVDEVLPRLADLVRTCDERAPLPTLLMGDSAGGALVLATAERLRDRGGPRPARLVLLSPWLDATLDEEQVADLEATDPMLAESGLRAAGRWWARPHSPTDPRVSPVGADLTGLPPTHLFIGRHDILRPAVDQLVDHARRDGLDLHVHETPAMFHVWMTRAIPEGARTRRQLRELVSASAP